MREAVDELLGELVPPMQQVQVKVDGATVIMHAATNWTENLGAGRGCVLELRRRMRAGTRPTADELAAALKLFDSDGDGMLSPAELKAILCRPSTGVVVCPLGGSTRSSRSLTQTGMACCQCGRAGQSVVSAEASDGGGAT